MRKLIVAIAVAVGASGAAHALTNQQELMKSCNVTAEGKKGAERKAHMRSCLSDGKKAQREKMKACNIEAKGKKGADRRTFMSSCLKDR